MPKENKHKIELVFSETQWNTIQEAIKRHRRRDMWEGVQFENELSESEYPYYFTLMCNEWLKQQNSYAMIKEFVREIKRS